MRIDETELDKAITDAPNWEVLEGTLYKLCRDYPDHTHRAGSNAKLWLIGRGLATGVERQIKATGGQGSTMQALCDHVHQHHRQADEIIGGLREVKEPLDEGNLRTIIEVHGKLCQLLAPILRGKKLGRWEKRSARSFASKYLHCHCPAVPIYDSVARDKLKTIFPWDDSFQVFKQPNEADESYYWFALRFWQLYQEARTMRPEVTVRLLDLYLLW